jgi:hypothetical protein
MTSMSTLFASCDETYFTKHASAFIKTAELHGEHVWINLVAPEDQHKDLIKRYGSSSYILTCSDGPAKATSDYDRAFFARSRFTKQVLSRVFVSFDEVLILDIDCFLRGSIEWTDFADVDYSLFLRDPLNGTVGWEMEGSRVAAGAVYFRDTSLSFLNVLQNMFEVHKPIWFIDQYCLYQVHKHFETNQLPLTFCQMPQKYIDWEFNPDTIIWTGKGARKTSTEYLFARETETNKNR